LNTRWKCSCEPKPQAAAIAGSDSSPLAAVRVDLLARLERWRAEHGAPPVAVTGVLRP